MQEEQFFVEQVEQEEGTEEENEPLTIIPAPIPISRLIRPLHFGHFCNGSSVILCNTSNLYSHLSHSYSYVGIGIPPKVNVQGSTTIYHLLSFSVKRG